jgi:hypothetical protein
MYLDRLGSWTDGPDQIFYFEAFDEPWKGGDDGWGLFTVAREPRYAIKDLLPALVSPDSSLTEADAVFYKVLEPRLVDASVYSVYADSLPAGAQTSREIGFVPWPWNAWENDTTGVAVEVLDDATSPEGTSHLSVTPDPLVWGWGMAYWLRESPENMSLFRDTGSLTFSIKTLYPGKLEIGFLTGSSADSDAKDVYLTLNPASNGYGYANDGAWHQVSIPIADILLQAMPSYGMPGNESGQATKGSASADLTKVTNTFVIAERYQYTAPLLANKGNTTPIYLDDIRWTRP